MTHLHLKLSAAGYTARFEEAGSGIIAVARPILGGLDAAISIPRGSHREALEDLARLLDIDVATCPECGGDGYFVYVGGPGYYSESFGNYLPSEDVVECPVCRGSGFVEGVEGA